MGSELLGQPGPRAEDARLRYGAGGPAENPARARSKAPPSAQLRVNEVRHAAVLLLTAHRPPLLQRSHQRGALHMIERVGAGGAILACRHAVLPAEDHADQSR